MTHLPKSSFVIGCLCPKLLWWTVHEPLAATKAALDANAPAVFEGGFQANGVYVGVDALVRGNDGVTLIEAKSTTDYRHTVMPAMAAPMLRLRNAAKKKRRKGTAVSMFLVYQAPKVRIRTEAVAPGVRALAWRDVLEKL